MTAPRSRKVPSGDVWHISVSTSSRAEEAVSELLERVLGCKAASYQDLATGAFVVSAFVPAAARFDTGVLKEIESGLEAMAIAGLDARPGIISRSKLRRSTWAESWKKHFRPLHIGSKLLLLPSWIRRKGRAGQKVIVLDPGLSFGTGHHPTTEFCLRELARMSGGARNIEPLSLLDVGSGSGILSIAGAKLGYSPVDAVEIDPEAVRISKANARSNRVLAHINFLEGNLKKLRPDTRYSVVCANLIGDLLIAERRRLFRLLVPGGNLVLAGILASEFHTVQSSFEGLGMNLVRSTARNEWRSGTFRRQ